MKVENWNGHKIRFVEKDGQWWAVLKDVCDALALRTDAVRNRLGDDPVSNGCVSDARGRSQEMLIVNEFGLYDTVFQSRKPEAKQFRHWVYTMLKNLREASGLEGYEVFKMLDREHQRKQMEALCRGLKRPVQVDFIKANTIANKAISNRYGYPKMVKKADMTSQMLTDREPVLEDTVQLMTLNYRYGLGVSVSEAIYQGVSAKQPA